MDNQPEDSDIPLPVDPSDTEQDLDISHPLYRVDDVIISRIDTSIRSYLGLADLDISIRFVTLKQIHDLNHNFRGKDQPTDVLAFPQLEWRTALEPGASWRSCVLPTHGSDGLGGGESHLGDVVICLEQAAAQAEDLGHDLGREVVFLLIHGTLHLCGHDHHEPEEEQAMIALQQRILTHLLELDMQPQWQQCISPKDAH